VVVTEGFGGSRIPRLAPLYVREPIVTAWHQVHADLFAAQYPKVLGGPLNLLERASAWVHRNTLVQAYTQEWKEAFPRIGFRPENIFVVPVSIRDEWLTDSHGQVTREPNILWIGKLRRYKCPHHLIEAMAAVVRRVENAHLIIAARRDDVAYERQLQKLVVDLDLSDKVEFRFNISDVDKRDLLRRSRLLVLPSSVEGFGIVVLEANACGTPVVASSGVPEGSVTSGYNGMRYRFGDVDGLGDTLVELLTNDELYGRLSANSREFATRFRWQEVSGRYASVLERVASTGRRP
jgi:glycosyltransferase involved in cell wall biosynthesis